MLYNVYSIKDTVANEFGPPFTAINDGVAKRSFNQMNFPEPLRKEYELHLLGTFDSLTGDLIPEMQYQLNTEEVNNG